MDHFTAQQVPVVNDLLPSKVSKLRHVKKSKRDLHCESAQLTDSNDYTQIVQFCLSMCEQMQNAPDFWMILVVDDRMDSFTYPFFC